jgi:hypothetical protein
MIGEKGPYVCRDFSIIAVHGGYVPLPQSPPKMAKKAFILSFFRKIYILLTVS